MESLRHDGAVVFWSLSKYTSRQVLNYNLAQMGLGQIEQRTAMSVLQDAIEDVHCLGDQFLVRPLNRGKEKGYCVVREERGDTKNDYTTLCSYTIDEKEQISAHHDTETAQLDAVAQRFFVLRDTLKPQQVSAMLLTNLRKFNGVRLNPNGFAYWIPEESRDVWDLLGESVAKASLGTSNFYSLTHSFDEEGLLAVKDALVRDVKAEIEEINADVTSGKLRVRALEARSAQAQALRLKVEKYEVLLSTGLSEMKDQVDDAHFAAAQAALVQSVAKESERIAKAEEKLRAIKGVAYGSAGQ